MDILLRKQSAHMNILRKIKRIVHDDFSVCSLNTKLFYHGLLISINLRRNNYSVIHLRNTCLLGSNWRTLTNKLAHCAWWWKHQYEEYCFQDSRWRLPWIRSIKYGHVTWKFIYVGPNIYYQIESTYSFTAKFSNKF